jgi:hypothetical protein
MAIADFAAAVTLGRGRDVVAAATLVIYIVH